ncbi:L-asparaginase-like [Siphateles boraxobius]|uniref:L-asparaginase-like n=1 Tax=Siphateles boraxobius TaxID=180520 RepID=UPI0040633F47
MQRSAKGDDIFRPIIIDGVVVRDKKFLQRLGKVLKLQWLHGKSVEIRKSLVDRIIPSFACRAVENNDFISLQVLLEKMDASCETYDEFTPLHTACELGNLEMINFLLSKGASPHHKNRFGNCPMYMAIKNRQCHAVKLLSLKGVTVRLRTVRIAMEMIQAVQNRDYPLLYAWFLSGVDMDTKDYNERTVMHEAVYLGDKSMIGRLLGFGATPLERDVWGQTAMDNAQNDTTIMALFEPFFTMRCPTKQAYLLFKAEHSHI